MIRIWGRATSTNVQKVVWICRELSLPYDRIDVGGKFGGLNDAEYVAINPNRRVPTIQDGDLVLWESNAILRHLARAYGSASGIVPNDLRSWAICDQWIDWQVSAFIPSFRDVIHELRKPPELQQADLIRAKYLAVEEQWRLLDTALADRDYVAGNHYSIADIPVGVWAARRYRLDFPNLPLTHLDSWYARLASRPPFRDAVLSVPAF